MTFAAACVLVLAARLGSGASGHHTGLYIAASVALALVVIGAAIFRGRRR